MRADYTTSTHVLGDWGTSHLRLYLMQGSRVCAEREGPGIGGLTRAPADVLQELLADWSREHSPLDVTLCGMASSRNGLQEIPYAEAPADVAGWAHAAKRLRIGALPVLLANGLKCQGQAGGVDVMRGEETQVFGALRVEPALREGDHCVVLPGTHSKWVALENGSIRSFGTAMTGELYELLSRNSTLLTAASEAGDASDSDNGFTAGSTDGLELRTSLLSALFRTRTAQLLQNRSRAWASGYLSGLLIGYEVASMDVASARSPATVTLIGSSQLAELYRRVFAAFGIAVSLLDGAECARSGLCELRTCWLNRGGEK